MTIYEKQIQEYENGLMPHPDDVREDQMDNDNWSDDDEAHYQSNLVTEYIEPISDNLWQPDFNNPWVNITPPTTAPIIIKKKPNKFIYEYRTTTWGSYVYDHYGNKMQKSRKPNPEYEIWLQQQNNKDMQDILEVIEPKEVVKEELSKLELKFEDIKFEKLKRYQDGIRAIIFFNNKLGALIQKHEDSDGYPNNYEVFVLKGNLNNYKVTETKDISLDGLGNLNEEEVLLALEIIFQYKC